MVEADQETRNDVEEEVVLKDEAVPAAGHEEEHKCRV